LIDRKDKLPAEEFQRRWAETLGNGTMPTAHSKILELFEANVPDERIHSALSPQGQAIWEQLCVLRQSLGTLFAGLSVRVDLSIARGFAYYTGVVFEIFDAHPQKENRRALFGGGRYDNLLAAFGAEPLSGVGFGVSDVALLNFCDTHGVSLDQPNRIDAAVVRFSADDRLAALELAARLRSQGIRCTSPLTEQKFGKQIQAAERMGAKAIAFRGSDEMKSNTFCLKWLATGDQEIFSMDQAGLASCAERLRPPEHTGRTVP
jgi:histidyl-tRNA synthetase